MRSPLRTPLPILNLILYFTLLIIFLTWPAIKHPIKFASILGICTTNCLIPPMNAEQMGGHRHTKEGNDSLCLRSLPKYNLIFMHYMLSAWWLHLLDSIVKYIIRPLSVVQILVMTNNMTLGYTYAKRRIKKTPDIFCKIAYIGRLIAWTPSR